MSTHFAIVYSFNGTQFVVLSMHILNMIPNVSTCSVANYSYLMVKNGSAFKRESYNEAEGDVGYPLNRFKLPRQSFITDRSKVILLLWCSVYCHMCKCYY